DDAGAAIGQSANLSKRAILQGRTFEPWGVFLGFSCTIDRRLLQWIDPAARPPRSVARRFAPGPVTARTFPGDRAR
ncbi:hypothetical protein SFC76_06355, partial [Sphingomonas sp. CD22]|uniref:hypothetical protein n=1 Tax=Sphingomonas sp. CD22 TaxID=3100214 RepID=UPI002AE0803E